MSVYWVHRPVQKIREGMSKVTFTDVYLLVDIHTLIFTFDMILGCPKTLPKAKPALSLPTFKFYWNFIKRYYQTLKRVSGSLMVLTLHT